ncbi:hypothetical protein EPN87_01580 [archaeon]|nr:MAG: hypothetical protein EPN87_01580 [archaeon]
MSKIESSLSEHEKAKSSIISDISTRYKVSTTVAYNTMLALIKAEDTIVRGKDLDDRTISKAVGSYFGDILRKAAAIKPSKDSYLSLLAYRKQLMEEILNEPSLKNSTFLDQANYAIARYLYDLKAPL